MKTKRLFIALLACAIVLVVGCSKDDEPAAASLELSSKNAISFTAAATAIEAVEIVVTTNQSSWDAVSDQTWCIVTKSGNKFTVTATPNTLLTAPAPAVITVSAGEAAPVKIDVTQLAKPDPIVAIKDAVFKAYLLTNFDTNNDSEISASEATAVETINVTGREELQSLEGIEAFVNLKKLQCGMTNLAALDISKNTALTELEIFMTPLTALDVSKNTALTALYCYMNKLTALDVTKNTALTDLRCTGNQIAALDVTKNTALTILACANNPLGVLDVSHNIELLEIDCQSNGLTVLDATKNTALTKLSCGDNDLTVLDVSKNTELTWLSCGGNKITTLDISNILGLWYFESYQSYYLTEVWMRVGQKENITIFQLDENITTVKIKQ